MVQEMNKLRYLRTEMIKLYEFIETFPLIKNYNNNNKKQSQNLFYGS